MKELPFVEDIYDLETEQLEMIFHEIKNELAKGPQHAKLPKGVDSYEKFERKAAKLIDCIELELEERAQVENVISFFTDTSAHRQLDDENFFNFHQNGKDKSTKKLEEKAFRSSIQQEDIDPQHVMDNISINFSQAGGQGTSTDDRSHENQSVFGAMPGKNKMSKKDLAAFMKAKLSQTKISSEVVTQAAATGPAQKNFKPPILTKPPPAQPVSLPKKSPAIAVKKQQNSSSDEEDWAKANSMMNRPLQRQYKEEHKVINTSKNIYKPCFNMPVKETYKQEPAAKKEHVPKVNKNDTTANKEPKVPKQEATTTNRSQNKTSAKNRTASTSKRAPSNSGRPVSKGSAFSKPSLMKTSSQLTTNQSVSKLAEPKVTTSELKPTKEPELELNSSKFDEEIESQYCDDEATSKATEVKLDQSTTQISSQQQPSSTDKNESAEDIEISNQNLEQEKSSSSEEMDAEQLQFIPVQLPKPQRQLTDLQWKEEQVVEQDEQEVQKDANQETKSENFYSLRDSQSMSVIEQDKEISMPVLLESEKVNVMPVEQFKQQKLEELHVEEISIQQKQSKQEQKIDITQRETLATKVEKPESEFDRIRRLVKTEKSAEEREQDRERLMQEVERQIQEARLQQQSATKQKEEKVQVAAPIVLQAKVQPQTKDSKNLSASVSKAPVQQIQKSNSKSKLVEMVAPAAAETTAIVAKKKAKIPKSIVDDDSLDYTHLYASFFDIFVGHQTDPKSFEMNYVMRENRNVYASFVNLMEGAHAVLMQQKVKFDANPLEKAYRDHQTNYIGVPDHFTMIGKNINEMENQIISRDQDLMLQAKSQMHLRERFKAQKGKAESQIVQEVLTVDDKKLTTLIDFDRKPTLFYRVIKNKTEVYDIITRSFARKPRWNELPHGLDLRNTWNLLWSWSKIKSDLQKLLVFQRANHFMGAKNVSRKDFLKQNIERARKFSKKADKEFNIMPLTFILPKEYVDFLTIFSDLEDKEGKMNYWIMKPAAMSRGRGISLVNEIGQITYGEPMVMQRYLKNPLLLNGYKFDLRIYVLVTSVNPLEAFIYKEGFGRFSTQPYTLDPNDKANKYIHLTNVSINKNNLKNYDVEAKDRAFGGTKVSLGTLKKTFVDDLKIDWDTQIWAQIKSTCIKALVAAQNDIQYNPACFDLYGFDIIFDEDLRAWLLEINSSPSLACDTLLDDMIKQRLIDDTIDLVNPLDFDRKRLVEVLERRIQEDVATTTGGQQVNKTNQKRQMNRDLTYILNGQMPRGYGEMPKMMGNFEIIVPTPSSEECMKLIGGQKMFGSVSKISERVNLEGVKGIGSLPKATDKEKASDQSQITPKPSQPRRAQAQPSQARGV